jgi:hypothetical protein
MTDGFSEYYFLKDLFVQSGFPKLQDSDYPPCGVIGLNKGCSADGECGMEKNAWHISLG